MLLHYNFALEENVLKHSLKVTVTLHFVVTRVRFFCLLQKAVLLTFYKKVYPPG